jgi:hypothetical protein
VEQIVLDTSVVISAFLKPSGKSRQVLRPVLFQEQRLMSLETLVLAPHFSVPIVAVSYYFSLIKINL